MSEHPLSSITKSHIVNGLRNVTNKQVGRFIADGFSAKITLHLDDEDGIRNGLLRLTIKESATNIMYDTVYHFKERHVEENIFKGGEFKLTPGAIELVANKWFSEFQEAARRANNNDKTILH